MTRYVYVHVYTLFFSLTDTKRDDEIRLLVSKQLLYLG